MVRLSPYKASVSNPRVASGVLRSGTEARTTNACSPTTKHSGADRACQQRFAKLHPSRRQLPPQLLHHGSRRLRLAALGSEGPARRSPAIEIEMRKTAGFRNELAEKQCSGDGARKGRLPNVVDVGDVAIEVTPIAVPKRQPP